MQQDFLFSKRDTNRASQLSILFENTWPSRISPWTWQINVSTLVTANVYIFAYDLWHTLDVALNRLTILSAIPKYLYMQYSGQIKKKTKKIRCDWNARMHFPASDNSFIFFFENRFVSEFWFLNIDQKIIFINFREC